MQSFCQETDFALADDIQKLKKTQNHCGGDTNSLLLSPPAPPLSVLHQGFGSNAFPPTNHQKAIPNSTKLDINQDMAIADKRMAADMTECRNHMDSDDLPKTIHSHQHHNHSLDSLQGESPSKKAKKSSRSSSSNSNNGTTTAPTGSVSSKSNRSSGRQEAAMAVAAIKEKGSNLGYNIFDKLKELYIELASQDSVSKKNMNLLNTSYLLDKLVDRENLNTLVLNLYPGNKGYSLAFKLTDKGIDGRISGQDRNFQRLQSSGAGSPTTTALPGGGDSRLLHETMRWPYEEEELLTCIDNEELPLMFVDLFEKRCPNLFYSGCVIVEVRDYRQSFPVSTTTFDKSHVLLRPTNQTLLADVNAITSEGEWTHEEKMALESQLIFAAAEPLCLDPDPEIGIRNINRQFQSRMFNSPAIRRQAKKFSQVAINRKRKTDQFTHHFGLELHDFVSKYRQKPRLSQGVGCSGGSSSNSVNSSSINKSPVTPSSSSSGQTTPGLSRLNSTPKRDSIQPIRAPCLDFPAQLAAPSDTGVTVEKAARAFERPRETKDCMPLLIEEYVLETDRGNGRVYHIKLSIFQRPANSEYLGELYVDRDYKEGERNGEACQFSLGSRAHANRYIQQFTEIFTEEGRKKVKITHLVPGQKPRVTCTGVWEHNQQFQQGQQQPQTSQQPQPQIQANVINKQPAPFPNKLVISTTPTPPAKSSLTNPSLASPTTPTSLPNNLLASPPPPQPPQQQQNMIGSQIKILPSIGQSQFIGFTTAPSPQQTTTDVNQLQVQQQAQQQQQIQYATIMNCDNNLLKNAITSSQLGIRNGSLVLLQPNQQVKAMQQQSQPQLQGLVTTIPQAQQRTGIVPNANMSVLQAQLQVGLPTMAQQQQNASQSQQIMNNAQQQNVQVLTTKSTNIHSTNPAINALFTSIINSANQFQQQQQQQQQAAVAANNNKSSNNSTIINLLNSAPAAMTNKSVNSLVGGTITSPPPSQSFITLDSPQSDPKTMSVVKGQQQQSQIGRIMTINGGLDTSMTSPPPSAHHLLPSSTETSPNVRVTMSALASQLASPPAVMTNSIIQQQNKILAGCPPGNIKLNLAGTPGNGTGSFINGPNVSRLSTGSGSSNLTNSPPTSMVQRRSDVGCLLSPGSGGDSNHSTASSVMSVSTAAGGLSIATAQSNSGQSGNNFSITMPTLNTLLTGGGGTGSNTSNSNSCSSSPVVAMQAKTTTILDIQSPGGTLTNNLNNSSTTTLSNNSVNSNNNNSMLIERLTSMNNNNSSTSLSGGVGGNTSSNLILQSQPFIINNTPSPAATNKISTGTTPIQQQQLQQFSNIQLQSIQPTVSSLQSPQQQQSQQSGQGTTTLNLQGLNLASLQGAMATIPGLQNVQVQIPGLAQPISLTFSNNNASQAGTLTTNPGGPGQHATGLLVSVPVSNTNQQTSTTQTAVVLTNNQGSGQHLPLPFAQIVTPSGLKGLNQQNVKHLVATTTPTTQTGAVSGPGPIQLVGLQMNTATRSMAGTSSTTPSIISAKQGTMPQRLNSTATISSSQQAVAVGNVARNLNAANTATTLKLTTSTQAPTTTSTNIFVNNTSNLNPILMQLKLQKQPQQLPNSQRK